MSQLIVPARAPGRGRGDTLDRTDPHRDWLGQLDEHKKAGLLVSHSDADISRAVGAAFQLVRAKLDPTEEMLRIMDLVERSSSVLVKRFCFIACFAVIPEIGAFYRPHCPVYKFAPWAAGLTAELDMFLSGTDADGRPECESWESAKYPTVDAFTANMVSLYVSR